MKTISSLALALSAASFAAAGPAKIEARATASSSGSASGTGSTSLPTVTTKGNAFFAGSDRFYIRGVDYQPGGSSDATDPLADYSTCSRDIPYFKKLGLNTIRVYTVDNSKNHDQCMNALAEAGIYLALDVNTPNYSLNRDTPGESYNPTYLQSIFATIDAFAGYTNTLLFFSGNEVINTDNSTTAAPYVKAVTRDMKQYIGERGYRSIPVGYSAADVSENQYLMAQYMDCGETPSISDFYAINNYEWCDPSSYTESGWSSLVDMYGNYSLPLFMSEYGCITNTRTFAETAELYKEEMTKVFSGGLVYEYSAEGNGYGIVTISGSDVSPVGQQFSYLQSALANVSDPSNGGGYSTDGKVQNCPDQSDNWDTKPFTGSALPAMPTGAEKYMKNGAGDGPGLSGDGSQNAGGGSSATASANAGAVSTTYGNGASSTGGSSSSGTASSAATAVQLASTDIAPFVGCFAMFISMMFGAALL
ncbi:1,3-beta-glucanosyltransferase gel1 [Pseudocercospora fuligena]|uniref:1,3-beta-glucanosyltransferase n=1 Tax=Pseudocercospora fuligena TaxID=685502 RepID=A0A8H6VNZ1_9PEZI|nr:1,3-beta-glucanosyltransferase gel1 [Pseudocercospora fuligena]